MVSSALFDHIENVRRRMGRKKQQVEGNTAEQNLRYPRVTRSLLEMKRPVALMKGRGEVRREEKRREEKRIKNLLTRQSRAVGRFLLFWGFFVQENGVGPI